MRLLGLILLIALGAGAESFEIKITDKQVSLQNLANLFADAVVSNVLPLVDVSKYQTNDDGSLYLPIISKGKLPESISFLDFTIPLPDNIFVLGHYGHSGTGFQGLHTWELGANITFVGPIAINLSASADEFALRGTGFDINLDLNMTTLVGLLLPDLVDFFPSTLNIAGIGDDYELVALKPYFSTVIEFTIRGDKPYLRTESVTLGFEGVNIYYKGLQMGGVDFDWETINFEDINSLIMQLMHALEKVLPAGFDFIFQFVIATCTPAEFLDGDLTCLFDLGLIPASSAAHETAYGLGVGFYLHSSPAVIFFGILTTLLAIRVQSDW